MTPVTRDVRERVIPGSVDAVGRMIDTPGSAGDEVWPTGRWPPLKLDLPLQVGAAGGHGPIRYRVESYAPGRRVRFRFLSPAGFVGTHGFDVEDALDKAEGAFRGAGPPRSWPRRVVFLRWLLRKSGGNRRRK